MSSFTPVDAFRSSNAVLRQRAAGGCPTASAELRRRAAKPPRSQLSTRKLVPVERATRPATTTRQGIQRDSLKAVRGEFDARLVRMEHTLAHVTAAVSKTHDAIAHLSRSVSGRLVA